MNLTKLGNDGQCSDSTVTGIPLLAVTQFPPTGTSLVHGDYVHGQRVWTLR